MQFVKIKVFSGIYVYKIALFERVVNICPKEISFLVSFVQFQSWNCCDLPFLGVKFGLMVLLRVNELTFRNSAWQLPKRSSREKNHRSFQRQCHHHPLHGLRVGEPWSSWLPWNNRWGWNLVGILWSSSLYGQRWRRTWEEDQDFQPNQRHRDRPCPFPHGWECHSKWLASWME